MTMTFHHDDLTIPYDDDGTGPLVVCLPGMGDLRSQYRFLAPRLVAAGHRVVCPDLRGHGDADVGASNTPVDVARDVLALLDHLGAPSATIVANSAAAATATWLAAEAPERVERLVLVGPIVADPPGHALLQWLMTLLFLKPWGPWLWGAYHRSLYKGGTPDDLDAHVAAVVEAARRPGHLRATRENGVSTKAACTARLTEVTAPVLAILGDADPDYGDLDAEVARLERDLSATTVVLPGVGHYPHAEVPDAVVDAVLPFLATPMEAPCPAQA